MEKHTEMSGIGRAQGSSPRITLSMRDSSLRSVIYEITRQAGIRPVYDDADTLTEKRVSVKLEKASLKQAFEQALRGTGLEATIASDGETVVIRRRAQESQSQQEVGRVTGHVIDSATQAGVPGATVTLQGTKFATTTDRGGRYLLGNVPVGKYTLNVKLFGYRSVSLPVQVSGGGEANIRVTLIALTTSLSEVVTTATGVQRKVEVGNDITTIDVEKVIQTSPVSTVTDLLVTRVPGVIVGKASGEPGAKTQIRIRGTSSIRASMEPIIIVDGVQVINARGDTTGFETSPIDQIDVNAISTIEVHKGPSAVALYGSNAANGVIVITTKRGGEGPARWNFLAALSQETLPGKWPMNYFAWGEDLMDGLGTVQCSRSSTIGGPSKWGTFPTCRYDSTTVYQVLNDPATTAFGKGVGKELSLGVSGGVRQFTYAFTGGFSSTLGILKVPDADMALLKQAGIDVASWQRRPQALENYHGTASIRFGLGDKSNLLYSTRFTQQEKRSTPLIKVLNTASSLGPPTALYDRDGVRIGVGSGVLSADFLGRQDWVELQFANAAHYQTTFWNAITFETSGGLTVASGRETYLLETGDYCPLNSSNNIGFGNCFATNAADYRSYRSSNVMTDLHVTMSRTPLGHRWLNVKPVIRFDMNSSTSGQSGIFAKGLPVGGRGIRGADTTGLLADGQRASRTVGILAQGTVGIANRLWLPFSVRMDAGSAIGSESKPIFPRVAFSYLVSDEPNFRSVPLVGRLPELRLRTAFGIAGRQPGDIDKHRTYAFSRFPIENVDAVVANINSVGNTKLSPELSLEWELGFDATVVENTQHRWSGTFTIARKQTSNLLTTLSLPPSLGLVTSRVGNLGDVENNAIEISIDGYQRMGKVDWEPSYSFSTQRGKLIRLNKDYEWSMARGGCTGVKDGCQQVGTRVGYPLNSLWAYPLLGYTDENGDGFLTSDEVVYGDNLRFVGNPDPRFTVKSTNTFIIASRLTVAATMTYEDGNTILAAWGNTGRSYQYSQMNNDPTISLEDQAKLLYDAFSVARRVSTLRVESVQITYNIPVRFSTRYLRAKSVQVAVAGTNLGRWSTFSGVDSRLGGLKGDLGTDYKLPIPRTFRISMGIR